MQAARKASSAVRRNPSWKMMVEMAESPIFHLKQHRSNYLEGSEPHLVAH